MPPTKRDDPRWRQDGTAPVVLPPHGYYLARGMTGVWRATTLGLLRRLRLSTPQPLDVRRN